MKLEDAKRDALQILNEERHYPTVRYKAVDTSGAGAPALAAELLKTAATAALPEYRREEPRTVVEGVFQYQFHSLNYDLLAKLFSRIDDAERQAFLDWMAGRIGVFPGSLRNDRAGYPSWNSQTSELPLISEFLVRNGGKQTLLKALSSCVPTPGLAVMVLQLEDTIALNYAAFSESEYSDLSTAVSYILKEANQLERRTRANGTAGTDWGRYGYSALAAARHIAGCCHSLIELCRKARYLYLRSSLDEGINLEINQDKYVVEGFLEKFGFSKPLLSALNEAEKLNSASATELELKASMGHLRSFMEQLHAEGVSQVDRIKKLAPPSDGRWGTLLAHLSASGVLSPQEEKFVSGLYILISDEAVHPLRAKREYARLARNVVIEYALLFLRKLEQLGIANGASA